MARKKTTLPEDYNAAFPSRLRQIMAEKGATQQDVGSAIGKTRQAVSYYADGSSAPDWKVLVSLSDYFNVSVDWLLGKTKAKSTDETVKTVCNYTGLSDNAVKQLHELSTTDNYRIALSFIEAFLSGKFEEFHRFALWAALSNVSYQKYRKELMNRYDASSNRTEKAEITEAMLPSLEIVRNIEEQRLWDEVSGKRPAGGGMEVSASVIANLLKEKADTHIRSALRIAIMNAESMIEEEFNI